MSRRPYRPPGRDGLTATRLVLPHDRVSVDRFPTAWDYLTVRFPDDVDRLAVKVDAGEVTDGHGRVVTRATGYEPRGFVYVFRDVAPEPVVPFDIPVLYQDENVLVVDKLHFLATTPRGAYVTRSAVVRLRQELGIADLSPVHRLDRLTAGVLMFTVRVEVRGAYQQLFDRRQVTKEYEAIAAWPGPGQALPARVQSRIVKVRGNLRAQEVPGVPNADSVIDLIEADESRGIARYRLAPRTGKTHQLRLHMARLGIPILGDNFYPDFYDVAEDDYSQPLQLVARSIEFADPLSGQLRRFATARMLTRWEDT